MIRQTYSSSSFKFLRSLPEWIVRRRRARKFAEEAKQRSSAVAILRGGVFYLQARSGTTRGVGIADGPVLAVSSAETDQLNESIREVFEHARSGLRHPAGREWKLIQKPMLEAAEVTSWKALTKGAKVVGLMKENGRITFEPTINFEKEGLGWPEECITAPFESEKLADCLLRTI